MMLVLVTTESILEYAILMDNFNCMITKIMLSLIKYKFMMMKKTPTLKYLLKFNLYTIVDKQLSIIIKIVL
jgi:hypothetical protein